MSDVIPLYEKVEGIFDLRVSSSGAQMGVLFEGMSEVERMWIDGDIWIKQRQKIEKLIREAEQRPVGDAIEIKVDPQVMKFIMSRIRLQPSTVAQRVLERSERAEAWAAATGDQYDYEIEMWKLKILAALTRRFNWSVFLLEASNLPNIIGRRKRS